ncbi:MAG: phosphotransferase, partial [Silicimonas sp.]|nr:phosphotransferase [Silicimonas sp.]
MTAGAMDVAREGGLAGAYVPVSEDRARVLLRTHYGFGGALKRFETEKDDTFRVTRDDGARFVLKIANPDEPWTEVEFQSALLDHVAARDPSLPVPRNVPDSRGRALFSEDFDGVVRIVRLLTYLEGTPLCETTSNAAERVQIGRMLARLRHATEGFSHP